MIATFYNNEPYSVTFFGFIKTEKYFFNLQYEIAYADN